MTYLAIDHLAFPSWDVAATHAFYGRLLGFAFAGASRGNDGWGRGPFLHFGYRLGDAVLTFFDVEGFTRPADDLPADVRHVALRVHSPEDVERWHARLRAAGTECWKERHGAAHSVYVRDPNGIAIEFTYDPAAAQDPAESVEVLEAWIRERQTSAP